MIFTIKGELNRDALVTFEGTLDELLSLASKLTTIVGAAPDPDADVRALALEPMSMIRAIKLHRERTGCTLKEAKDHVEALMGRKVGAP
ncbi:MAG TPA: hypothetical protein VN613_12550 [Gemmatimonadaceae bacterium]|nr:hypothetical protein [Gemmatimonadaceae bacterium]